MEGRTLSVHGAPQSRTLPTLLSEGERVIVRLLAEGFSNREIGRQVPASRATIDRSMRGLVRKLEARNRMEAVAKAIRAGLV